MPAPHYSRGAYGRPRHQRPPEPYPKPPPRRLPSCLRWTTAAWPQALPALKRHGITLGLLVIGAAIGTAIGITLLSTADQALPTDPRGRPAAPRLPDYAATLRAPTPTPSGEHPVATNVHVTPADIIAFKSFSIGKAAHDATAIAAGDSQHRLMHLVAEPEAIAQCYRTLHETMEPLPLLPQTNRYSAQAAECLIPAVKDLAPDDNAYAALDHAARTRQATKFLQRYAIVVNPSTQRTAHEPSPFNMGRWRESRDHHQECYADLTERAARVAAYTAPAAAALQLQLESAGVAECLHKIEWHLNQPNPTGDSPH